MYVYTPMFGLSLGDRASMWVSIDFPDWEASHAKPVRYTKTESRPCFDEATVPEKVRHYNATPTQPCLREHSVSNGSHGMLAAAKG